MILYLASPHTILRFKDGYPIFKAILGGGEDIKVFLASVLSTGSMSVQLTPERAEQILTGRELDNENFWRGGEGRHWIQDRLSPVKENEDIPCGQHIVSPIYRSDSIRGGL